jgi:hypothetical protein
MVRMGEEDPLGGGGGGQTARQCYGSGMFIPVTSFFHPGSRIPDLHQRI